MFGRGFEEYLHLQNTAIIELMKSLCFYSATAVQLRQNSITCTRHKLLGSTSCQFVCVWKSDTLHLLVSNHVSYVACIFIVVNAIFRQQCVFQQGRRWEVQLLRMFSRLVLWNILVVPYIGNNHPNWYFSEGLKPPTSQCVGAPGGGSSISQRHVWGNGSQMRVSGYPKRMVYEGKSYKNGWFGGTPISGNPQIWLKKYDWMIVVLGSWPYSISNPPPVLLRLAGTTMASSGITARPCSWCRGTTRPPMAIAKPVLGLKNHQKGPFSFEDHWISVVAVLRTSLSGQWVSHGKMILVCLIF